MTITKKAGAAGIPFSWRMALRRQCLGRTVSLSNTFAAMLRASICAQGHHSAPERHPQREVDPVTGKGSQNSNNAIQRAAR